MFHTGRTVNEVDQWSTDREIAMIGRPLPAAAAQAQPRRRIHGGDGAAPPRHLMGATAAIADASSTASQIRLDRRSTWRAAIVGALVGLLIVMVLLMKWLLEFQVTAAAQRRVEQTATRAAIARCFELASPRAVDGCRKELEARSSPAE
jgi:hypothetical protein